MDRAWRHTHGQEMDKVWRGYLERLADNLGDNTGFDISTMAKFSELIDAAFHMQWFVHIGSELAHHD